MKKIQGKVRDSPNSAHPTTGPEASRLRGKGGEGGKSIKKGEKKTPEALENLQVFRKRRGKGVDRGTSKKKQH